MILLCNRCKKQNVKLETYVDEICFSCYIELATLGGYSKEIIIDIIKHFRHIWINEQKEIDAYLVAVGI
jgi:hypothetical protein